MIDEVSLVLFIPKHKKEIISAGRHDTMLLVIQNTESSAKSSIKEKE